MSMSKISSSSLTTFSDFSRLFVDVTVDILLEDASSVAALFEVVDSLPNRNSVIFEIDSFSDSVSARKRVKVIFLLNEKSKLVFCKYPYQLIILLLC